MVKIAPSILSADFARLGEQIEILNNCRADFIHIDVMDGCFVPNISFGVPIINSIRHLTDIPFDTHLMIDEPSRYVEKFIKAGSDIVTIHYEADKHIDRTIRYIKSLGAKACVALNPGTPVCMLDNLIKDLDMVLIMSVNPGFGGQTFIDYTYKKIEKVREISEKCNKNMMIEVDGGIDSGNIDKIVKAGADVLVAGSSVFRDGKIAENIEILRRNLT